MARLAYLGSMALVTLACATLPACGQQDDTQRIIAQCNNPPPDQIDSCLEQARVQEETDPSPEAQKLVANLIKLQVEARNAPRDLEPPPPPLPDDGSDPNAFESPPAPPPPDAEGGSYEAPPVSAPQDIAPPVMQGNPAQQDDTDEDTPPTPRGDPQNPLPDNGGGPEGT
jgi:hypothetical protein